MALYKIIKWSGDICSWDEDTWDNILNHSLFSDGRCVIPAPMALNIYSFYTNPYTSFIFSNENFKKRYSISQKFYQKLEIAISCQLFICKMSFYLPLRI